MQVSETETLWEDDYSIGNPRHNRSQKGTDE